MVGGHSQPVAGSASASSHGKERAAPRSRQEITQRLDEITTKLQHLGATEAYCKDYFHSGAGSCEEHFAGVCVDHRGCCAALPHGLMCSRKFARQLQYLRKRIQIVEGERVVLKRQWEEFKTQHEVVENMLVNNEEGQTMAKERRTCLQSQISHQLGELRKLQGERYRLLSGIRPINAKHFHEQVTACLMNKMALLEELAMNGMRESGPAERA